MGRERVKICIDVPKDAAELLAVLAHSDAIGDRELDDTVQAKAIASLEHLVNSVAAGVMRPGSWERGWVEQAFGSGWHALLETDPKADWRQRPRARGGL